MYNVPSATMPMLVPDRSAFSTGEPTPNTMAADADFVSDRAAWDRSEPDDVRTTARVKANAARVDGLKKRLEFMGRFYAAPAQPQGFGTYKGRQIQGEIEFATVRRPGRVVTTE